MHHLKRVSCKQCDYVATSKAKMRQHIRQHMTGLACSKYDKSFPTLSEVIRHEQLHEERVVVFECDNCDLVYHTQSAFTREASMETVTFAPLVSIDLTLQSKREGMKRTANIDM